MTTDPLADVIHKAADEWFDTSDGRTIWEHEADAVRAHLRAALDAESEKCFLKRGNPITGLEAIDNLRTALLP